MRMKSKAAPALLDPINIEMGEMEIGDIGIFTGPQFEGEVVRRSNGGWMVIAGEDRFWDNHAVKNMREISRRTVRILQPGETVTIAVSK